MQIMRRQWVATSNDFIKTAQTRQQSKKLRLNFEDRSLCRNARNIAAELQRIAHTLLGMQENNFIY